MGWASGGRGIRREGQERRDRKERGDFWLKLYYYRKDYLYN